MKKCYYEILGLKKPSNEGEIRKAYKKMAVKWHPDKNPDNLKEAEEKFKEVGEAYSVLSDANKKQVYDTYGHEGMTQGGGRSRGEGFEGGFTFHRAEDIFKTFFDKGFFDDDDDFFGNAFGRKKTGNKGREARDPFSRFGGGFGDFGDIGGGIFSSASMFQEGFGGGGYFGTSTSTSTVIKDGKKVTIKKVTKTNPDGTRTTEVTESVTEGGKTSQKNYIENGTGQKPTHSIKR